ncbi:tyrosine-type recombinase/integrase [Actinomadura nitritigenes]|uniref:Site-specific integrase n=1 Tax=Actinomadura nitritigenes TaxID=134602 RepID=A0ABS3R387_9ACTN|nr:site-specific integrase [Actinomadura nitritigenes]MBO2440287.1 site-specific integrase [Actinomadura nitritigenes]
MKGAVFKRCRCTNPKTGKRYDTNCPEIKKKGHGTWWFRYEAPASVDGKRRRPRVGPFKRKEDAEEELIKELAKIGLDGQASDRQMTVAQWLDRWLAGKVDLKSSTLASYREAVELYHKPALGHLRLVDLRAHHASELYAEMMKINRPEFAGEKCSEMMRRLIDARADSSKRTGPAGERLKKHTRPVSPARIKRVHAVLSSAMGSAAKKKYLPHNPVEHVELPRVPRRKPLVWTAARIARWEQTRKAPAAVMVWTPEQTGAFLDYIYESERLYAMFHLVALRGLRRAEVAGLPWSDVDLDAGILAVRETRPDDDLEVDDTKSEAGDRTITLDSTTVDILRSWRTHQRSERLAAGPAWVDSALVFTRPDGSPLRPEWISQRLDLLLKQYEAIRRRYAEDGWDLSRIARQHRVSEAKARAAIEGGPLPPIRLHDLRHGAATLSLTAGVDMKVVSETLGHARSAFTADVYASVVPQVFKAAAEASAAVVPRRFGPPSAPQSKTSGPLDARHIERTAGSGGGSGI